MSPMGDRDYRIFPFGGLVGGESFGDGGGSINGGFSNFGGVFYYFQQLQVFGIAHGSPLSCNETHTSLSQIIRFIFYGLMRFQ